MVLMASSLNQRDAAYRKELIFTNGREEFLSRACRTRINRNTDDNLEEEILINEYEGYVGMPVPYTTVFNKRVLSHCWDIKFSRGKAIP